MSFNIAIDGPAGAGKSTIAKLLAKKTGFLYVDTGAMYRGIAYYFLKNEISRDDIEGLKKGCDNIDITLKYKDDAQCVILNGEDITPYIRAEEVGKMASATSALAFVREKLLNLQKDLAAQYDVIMDGRDIGTTILPDAQLKIYLTASVDTRAARRYDELVAKGNECDYEAIKADIEKRDYDDMHRDISPLRKADDAREIDSSFMTIEEVVDAIYELAKTAGL